MITYLPILVMIGLVFAFVIVSFFASLVLAPSRTNIAKRAPYESGIVPSQEPAERFPVKFYLVAMSFIVLDVEIVFLYPFSTVFRQLGGFGLALMGVFVAVLLIPFGYLIAVGAVSWGPRQIVAALRAGPVLRAREAVFDPAARPADADPDATGEEAA